jgi:hypothetical protein
MNIKNVVRNEIGSFDCEVEHPVFGWIPFTASPDDVEFFGRELYGRISEGEFGIIADYDPPVDDVNE